MQSGGSSSLLGDSVFGSGQGHPGNGVLHGKPLDLDGVSRRLPPRSLAGLHLLQEGVLQSCMQGLQASLGAGHERCQIAQLQ
jgi:hypothetical protein